MGELERASTTAFNPSVSIEPVFWPKCYPPCSISKKGFKRLAVVDLYDLFYPSYTQSLNKLL